MNNKFYNDAIIGNKNMVATYSKTGELLRICYPNIDYKQFIDFFHTGIKVNDSNIIYCHSDINNRYNQYYTEETNILNTEILNTYFKLRIIQTDFVSINKDVLIKRYKFINENTIDLDVNFLIHSKTYNHSDNSLGAKVTEDALMQYSYDYSLCILSKNKILSSQLHNSKETITKGTVWGKDEIGMTEDSSISYDIGTIKPKEEKILEIMVYLNDNKETYNLNAIQSKIQEIKKLEVEKEYIATKKYWQKYILEHDNLKIEFKKLNEKVENIYKRTILLYPLLLNYETGGISAAVEVDEQRKYCGGYAYCWTRDAVFITKAMDILNMKKETDKFYKVFCKNTQYENGTWEQRFYTSGILAPCWGYQVDETAGVIYGVLEHYKYTEEIKFLKDTLKMVEKATKFLKKYTNDLLENKNKIRLSYDIWEMNEGVHTYSLASIFAAFNSMLEIYNIIKPEYKENRLRIERIAKEEEELKKLLVEIKKYVLEKMYDNNRKSFVAHHGERNLDISTIGAVTPFNMFSAKEKKITNTIEMLNLTLRTYTGGYKRFEGDHYMGGENPWTITTLWMALYYLKAGEKQKAKECFNFVTNTSTGHGLLGEQVDNKTMQTSWVIGLGWAHAMYILVLKELNEKGII